jgi:hypothetical protein
MPASSFHLIKWTHGPKTDQHLFFSRGNHLSLLQQACLSVRNSPHESARGADHIPIPATTSSPSPVRTKSPSKPASSKRRMSFEKDGKLCTHFCYKRLVTKSTTGRASKRFMRSSDAIVDLQVRTSGDDKVDAGLDENEQQSTQAGTDEDAAQWLLAGDAAVDFAEGDVQWLEALGAGACADSGTNEDGGGVQVSADRIDSTAETDEDADFSQVYETESECSNGAVAWLDAKNAIDEDGSYLGFLSEEELDSEIKRLSRLHQEENASTARLRDQHSLYRKLNVRALTSMHLLAMLI